MNVLVTGATGFIGSALCVALTGAGHAVSTLSRDPERAKLRVPALERAFPWDPAVPPPVDALNGVDAVVHLAGESLLGRWTPRKKREIRDSRILGTRNLVETIEAAGPKPKVLVSASAVGRYGDRGDEELTEQSPPAEDFLAKVTVDWESEAARARPHGLRVVTLRTGLPLGRGGGTLGALLPLSRLCLVGPLGSGRQWWPWVHLDDMIGIVITALESDWDGAVNVAAPEPVRQRDFARILGRVVRRPALLPAPAFAMKAVLGELANELLYSRRALPFQAQAWGDRFRFTELEPALRDLL